MSAELDPTEVVPVPQSRLPLKLEQVVLAIAMGMIAVITGANVLMRYLTNISLAFTEEYSVALMVTVSLVGTSYAVARGQHISVQYFLRFMSAKTRARLDVMGILMTLALFSLLLVFGTKITWDDYRFNALTPGMNYPQWIFTGVIPLFSVLVLVRVVGRIVTYFKGPT